jgi:hypothetical protein
MGLRTQKAQCSSLPTGAARHGAAHESRRLVSSRHVKSRNHGLSLECFFQLIKLKLRLYASFEFLTNRFIYSGPEDALSCRCSRTAVLSSEAANAMGDVVKRHLSTSPMTRGRVMHYKTTKDASSQDQYSFLCFMALQLSLWECFVIASPPSYIYVQCT